MRRAALAIGAAVISLALGACGSDEDEGGFSPVVSDSLSKVEFLRQADDICFRSEARIEAAADEIATAPGQPDPQEVAQIAIDVVVPSLESEVAAIGALGAPEGDEQKVQEILDATEQGIEEIRSDPEGLLDGVPPGLAKAQRLAEAYGSEQCGIR